MNKGDKTRGYQEMKNEENKYWVFFSIFCCKYGFDILYKGDVQLTTLSLSFSFSLLHPTGFKKYKRSLILTMKFNTSVM